MAEMMNSNVLENERFLTNTEQTMRNQEDEDLLQEVAEFIMLTAEKAANPNLAAKLRDLANMIVQNKAILAKTPGSQGYAPPMTPEEELAAQGMAQAGVPYMPPGM